MIKKCIAALASFIILAMPAGLVFADDDGISHSDSNTSVTSRIHGEDINEGDTSELDGVGHSQIHTTGTTSSILGSNGDKNGLLKHFGTTTPPGIAHQEIGSSSENHASSTNDFGNIENHATIPFFSLLQKFLNFFHFGSKQ